MSSPDWLGLNDEERYDRIEPIYQQFVQRFSELPSINHITHTPSCILVGTSLSHGKTINELPSEFLGVPVEQDPVREDMDRFIAIWKTVLERIGNWPSDRIAAFANDHHICFRSSWFLHDTPLECIGSELLPEELCGVAGIEGVHRIIDAIESGIATEADKWHPNLGAKFDWLAAKERVDRVIAELRMTHSTTWDSDSSSTDKA